MRIYSVILHGCALVAIYYLTASVWHLKSEVRWLKEEAAINERVRNSQSNQLEILFNKPTPAPSLEPSILVPGTVSIVEPTKAFEALRDAREANR